MNELSKIDMAKLVLTDDKKVKITDTLRSFYGVTDVQYRDLSYGICIDVSGSNSFNFIKLAITKILNVSNETLTVIKESEKTLFASYVYMPEKDKNLAKKFKKTK